MLHRRSVSVTAWRGRRVVPATPLSDGIPSPLSPEQQEALGGLSILFGLFSLTGLIGIVVAYCLWSMYTTVANPSADSAVEGLFG